MKRRLRMLALLLIALSAMSAASVASSAECLQAVKIIVPFPAGGPDDLVARIIAQNLSEAGGRVHVENMPGATGMIGTAAVARSESDGCALLITNQNLITQTAVGAKNPYDVLDSFTPVTLQLAAPEAISVNPSVPATTMQELITLTKANPAKYNYASPGYGSSPHLAGERLFRQTLGLDIVHVPFTGGPPAINATIAGHTQVLAITLPLVADLIKEGKLRLLTIAAKTRSPQFPDVATLSESGVPSHDVGFWNGILLPKGASKDTVEQVHLQVTKIASLPDVKDRLAALGYSLINGPPEAFAAHLNAELANWSAIARDQNVRID